MTKLGRVSEVRAHYPGLRCRMFCWLNQTGGLYGAEEGDRECVRQLSTEGTPIWLFSVRYEKLLVIVRVKKDSKKVCEIAKKYFFLMGHFFSPKLQKGSAYANYMSFYFDCFLTVYRESNLLPVFTFF